MEIKKNNTNVIFKTLGSNIRKARLLKGLSQENLSNCLDKTLNFISLIETGKKGVSVPTLVDIGKALNVNANILFDGVFTTEECDEEKFIIDTIRTLNDKDRKAVIDFLKYIIESKN